MTESFTNKYVISVTTGHPGATSYDVVSTREALTEMARALLNKLNDADGAPAGNLQAQTSPLLLWSDYATIAHGKTSRVYLSFFIAEDLATYHGGPSLLKRAANLLGFFLIIGLLVLAGIGVYSLVNH